MHLTRVAINVPAISLILCVLVLLFGSLSLLNLPMQMIPQIERPQIMISSGWAGANPDQMESVVMQPMEQVLKGISGLEDMRSLSMQGVGLLFLEFGLNTDMQQALLDVMSNLNMMPPLPYEVSRPQISTSTSYRVSTAMTVASLQVRPIDLDLVDYDIDAQRDLIRDKLVQPLEKIPGVTLVHWQNFRKNEVEIEFDSVKAAARGIRMADIRTVVRDATDSAGGTVNLGDKRYTINFEGQFDLDTMRELVVGNNEGIPIRLKDIARVRLVKEKRGMYTTRNGVPSFYLRIIRDPEANTVDVLKDVSRVLNEANVGALGSRGVVAEYSFDALVYIQQALALLQSSLGMGVLLALLILFSFLRSWRSTLMISVSIPLALAMAVIVLNLMDRSINVISLAGMAFAVGLVLDAAIIVQEAILQRLEQGGDKLHAIISASEKVAGALLSSTLTSVVIFIPILFLKGLEGQLFTDLAITMAVAVLSSFVVAISIIPLLNVLWPPSARSIDPFTPHWQRLSRLLTRFVRSPVRALFIISSVLAGSVLGLVSLSPGVDFLPRANTHGIGYKLVLKPGTTDDVRYGSLPQQLHQALKPHWDGSHEIQIDNYNYYSTEVGDTGGFIYPINPAHAIPLKALIDKDILPQLPVVSAFSYRGSMLGISADDSLSVDVSIQGPDTQRLLIIAEQLEHTLSAWDSSLRTLAMPDLRVQEPRLSIVPDSVAIARNGLSYQQVIDVIRAAGDGSYLSEFFDGNERVRVYLRLPQWQDIRTLENLMITNQQGDPVSLGSIATIKEESSPALLLRQNGWRTLNLTIPLPHERALGEVVNEIRTHVLDKIEAELPAGYRIIISGSASKMAQSVNQVSYNFAIALFILTLVMAAFFRSMTDSLLVMSLIPCAGLGGILGLKLINVFTLQTLDLLTLIGFVILLGLVVNNAILLVNECRLCQRQGLSQLQAVYQALNVRLRPILLSTLTSVVGMLPLILFPGPGAQIYRGLATVIVAGMLLSTLFCLVLLPASLRLLPVAQHQHQ